jgi:hypothetical protein
LQDVARIRAALLALDTGDLAGAKERAASLNTPGNSWRHVAREVIGTAAYQAGDLKAARDAFTEIQQDAETPQDLWIRSGLMVSLIDGQLAAPAAEASKAPPASGSAPAAAPTPEAGGSAAPVTGDTAAGAAPAELPVPTEGTTGLPATGMGDDAGGGTGPAPVAPGPAPSPAPTTAPVPAPDVSGTPPTAPTP